MQTSKIGLHTYTQKSIKGIFVACSYYDAIIFPVKIFLTNLLLITYLGNALSQFKFHLGILILNYLKH